jgi:hypothetical protein
MGVSFPYLEGLDLASGSEKGWAINAAKLFMSMGHEVHIGNSPLEKGLEADIMYLPSRIDLRDDQTAWNFYKTKARKFLFGVFNPREARFLRDVPKDSTLVTPFRSCGTICHVLPYAYYSRPPVPGYSRKTVGWTIRNPFDFYGQPIPNLPVHLYHLKACKELVESGCNLILFSNNTYPENPSGLPGGVMEAHAILNGLRNNPRVKTVDHLLYSQYIDLLGQTSIVIPLDGLGSTTEALKLGSVPLNWSSPVNIYNGFPSSMNYNSLNYEMIDNKLQRLVSDEGFYNNEFNRLFDHAAVYSLNKAQQLLDGLLAAL